MFLASLRAATAHLIHGSSEGRFSITYCTRRLTRTEVEGVHFNNMPYDEAVLRYDPAALKPGWNTLPGGEEIHYISNPAPGLWAGRNRY